ncbi:MAG: hypothetical protein J6K58_15135 [Lachnospiraceae bacterium]|nr:hypothetical protein [Lachnospiraceae bacterium]
MEESHIKEAADDHQSLYGEMDQILEEREAISKAIREIDGDMELFDDIQRAVRGVFKEIWKHCEEELWDCGRRNESRLEERKELLEEKKRNNFDREDEIREQLWRRENHR